MTAIEASEFVEAAKVLIANEMLEAIIVSDMPHMQDKSRKDVYKKISRQANKGQESKALSFDQFAKKVGLTNG